METQIKSWFFNIINNISNHLPEMFYTAQISEIKELRKTRKTRKKDMITVLPGNPVHYCQLGWRKDA